MLTRFGVNVADLLNLKDVANSESREDMALPLLHFHERTPKEAQILPRSFPGTEHVRKHHNVTSL